MTTATPKELPATPVSDDVFLDGLAKRISDALYYGTQGPIGVNGGVSPGLLHDDYDRLRAMAKAMRIASLRAALIAEGVEP